ncbi:hypothetical protein FJZ40_04115, partial [Candidatus Shapirobacteria bacterium]|nr:hypothetical protein [Candidatus Shapirobacteria bacterium]
MTPRQRIATVAYAFNAEYLQGYDLAKATNADPTATGGATINTVPIINPSGNLVIAAASPTIWSTSGTFGLKGQAVTISTPDTSNGSITVNPDGSGVLNLTFEGSTGKFINATNANIGGAGGKEANALFYGYAGTDSTNYNLLKLESGSSAVPKFTVDASGNASAAGTLKTLSTAADALDVAGGIYAGTADAFKVNTSGAITAGAWQGTAVGTQYGGTGQDWSAVAQGSVPYFSGTGTMATLGPSTSGYVLTTQGAGANPTWSDISASGGPWTTANGTLYPDNSTLDLLIGGAATTSAKFAFTNVLTGTPTATFSGNLVLAGGSRTISATDMNNLTIGNSSTQNLILNPNSNVGVGTTNPLQKLHVEGQCVAEDSLIPTLKSSANLKFEIFNFQSNSNDLILKQIKNIEAGDQVLSLNEHAGQFEWQKVEKTLDMGVREVYELITESGKRIETTGNHPYLARRLFSGKFSKEDKSQENHDQSYSPTDIYLSRQIGKINHSFSKISSSLTANVIDTIPSNRESVKTENSLTVSGRIRRPDPTLVNTAESTLSWEGRNAIEKPINESVEESKNIVNRLAKSKWIKVAYLKVGDEIATLDGWEKVVSLKITGRKHVYDLQIANTHNFVANGIVAHNTYISS